MIRTALLLFINLLLLLNQHTATAEEIRLPDGVTEEDLDKVVEEAFHHLLTQMQEDQAERRRLGEESFEQDKPRTPCNTVVTTISAEEMRQEVLNGFGAQAIIKQWQLALLDIAVSSRIRYDIQVWKICGRCSDFGPGEVGCREQDYGYNALHSGLLIAPYDVEAGGFIQDTLPVNIIPPAAGSIPSEATFPATDPQVLIAGYVTATTRAFSLMVDYIGFGESQEYYRGFLIYQSVVTATVPLLWQAEKIVSSVSDCSAAMVTGPCLETPSFSPLPGE